MDQAPTVEGNTVLVEAHAWVCHELGPGVISHRLRRPFDPAEDDRLTLSGFDGAPEIGDLADWHVIAPALDHTERAMFPEQACGEGRHLDVGVAIGRRHRQ